MQKAVSTWTPWTIGISVIAFAVTTLGTVKKEYLSCGAEFTDCAARAVGAYLGAIAIPLLIAWLASKVKYAQPKNAFHWYFSLLFLLFSYFSYIGSLQ